MVEKMIVTQYSPAGSNNWTGDDVDELMEEVIKFAPEELYDLIEASLYFVAGYGIDVTVEFSYGGAIYVIKDQNV